ncbi:hypothetical protein E6C27_scaffold1770G00030 [Cucumis melo var. makuwa]|uniref:Ty3-gypsy retrotransposon protein n=1 Tax=Cucumis melo var. makuwa TaxID=1194695 RepID=A0A5A7TUE2_CUCMM|nr:hypothetical protein E6C27_scaffold1770G00030 [Cucumis melo var. makuwa]
MIVSSLNIGVRLGPIFRSLKVDLLSVDSIEGHNQVSGKGFPTTGPRIEVGNVVIHRGLHVSNVTASCSLCAIGCKELFTDRRRCPDVPCIVVMLMGYVVDRNCMSIDFKVLRLDGLVWTEGLICASFGSTRLICASLGITRLIGVSFGITRLIRASFEITRLMCAFYGTTRLLCRVRVQRGVDRRGARRMREGHMDASGFLYASADVFCVSEVTLEFRGVTASVVGTTLLYLIMLLGYVVNWNSMSMDYEILMLYEVEVCYLDTGYELCRGGKCMAKGRPARGKKDA